MQENLFHFDFLYAGKAHESMKYFSDKLYPLFEKPIELLPGLEGYFKIQSERGEEVEFLGKSMAHRNITISLDTISASSAYEPKDDFRPAIQREKIIPALEEKIKSAVAGPNCVVLGNMHPRI
ncbi:hypothetical protein JXB27_03660 [Candidatus Woesearchaeota archaeon]|nr:hypothetical protein [Candidatus Woesearchaeota archaeon]